MGYKGSPHIELSQLNKKFFILIPSLVPSGPVKGAIAFANEISDRRLVKLISLKRCSVDWSFSVAECVEIICLDDLHSSWFGKVKAYRELLQKAGGRERVLSMSMCFSADMLNLLCRNSAEIFSSIRGNLPLNYKMEFGFLGLLLAYFHLATLRAFDHVSVMSQAMARQVLPILSTKPFIVGNFIDEKAIEQYRGNYICNNKFKFIFVGSLTERKQPLLLLESIIALRKEGHEISLDILGSGPLESAVRSFLLLHHLGSSVTLHGQIDCPYDLVSRADAFVLPSLSEGISRAALESLHLGLPCILRKVDGNDELVRPGVNGDLFEKNKELIDIMRKLIKNKSRCTKSLVPPEFRQETQSSRILSIVEKDLP